MSMQLRRVVTGHDLAGKAVVLIDEFCSNVRPMRHGVDASVVWTTQGFPVDNQGNADGSLRPVSTSESDGTVFRVVSYAPGAAPRNHRTESIDYAVVISGEIDMDLDGTEVHLHAGDVLVQRGTVHDWINRGNVPCVIAFVLIGAHPVHAGATTLHGVG